MKKLFILLILTLLVFLFCCSDAAMLACREGIDLFVVRVLPSLLPFLIAGGTLARLGAADILARPFAKIFSRLFSLPGKSAFVFFSGILCGNPIAAQNAAQLSQQHELDANQTIRTAALSSFVSPAFLVGTVAYSMLGDPKSLLPVATGHYLGAIASGIIFALPLQITKLPQAAVTDTHSFISPLTALMQSVASAAEILPKICVFLAFFTVLNAALNQAGLFRLIESFAQDLALPDGLLTALCTGFLEVTTGCAALGTVSVSAPLLYACTSAMLSFGGLCILCQNAACLGVVGAKMGHFFAFRLVHATFAFLFTYGVSLLL